MTAARSRYGALVKAANGQKDLSALELDNRTDRPGLRAPYDVSRYPVRVPSGCSYAVRAPPWRSGPGASETTSLCDSGNIVLDALRRRRPVRDFDSMEEWAGVI